MRITFAVTGQEELLDLGTWTDCDCMGHPKMRILPQGHRNIRGHHWSPPSRRDFPQELAPDRECPHHAPPGEGHPLHLHRQMVGRQTERHGGCAVTSTRANHIRRHDPAHQSMCPSSQKGPRPHYRMRRPMPNLQHDQGCISKIPKTTRPPCDHPARRLKRIWDQISITDEGIIMVDGDKIYMPLGTRKHTMETLHKGHCGYGKTLETAQGLYFWPSMRHDIKALCDNCEECQRLKPSKPLQPFITTTATFPMEMLSVDLFHVGN